MLRSPSPLSARNLLGWIVFVVALVVAIAERGTIERALSCGGPSPATALHTLTAFINTYCGGVGMTVLAVVAYVAGRVRQRDALADAALVLAAAGLWSLVLTELGQFVLADTRPKDGGALLFFDVHGHGISGHASSASLLMAPARDVLLRDRAQSTRMLVSTVLVAWAIFVGWTRIYLGMHHAWNVVLGLGLGFACANAATRAFAAR